MGVKCHDSEREVPRLIKILDEIKFSDNKLKIYLLKQKINQINIMCVINL